MNKIKKMNIHLIKLLYTLEDFSENLKGSELLRVLDGIRSLPIDVGSENSRYTLPGSNNEHCLIFLDETTLGYKKSNEMIPALFIHRRGNSHPFEEDGKGNLIELKLENSKNELAEIAFLLFNITNGYFFWVYNPFVGGINQFTNYINSKIVQLSKIGFEKHKLYEGYPTIDVAHIIQENAFEEFNDILSIRSLQYSICSTPETLTQKFLQEEDDRKGMELIRYFAENSKCARISIELGADKKKKDKKTKRRTIPSLDKSFIVKLYEQTEGLLKENKNNEFNVVGMGADEDSKVIDLLYKRLMYRIEVEFESTFVPINEIIDKMTSLMIGKNDEVKKYC